MIKIEDVVTMSPEQLMTVIKGTRNPMNSWSRIDSEIKYENVRDNAGYLEIGPNDHELMMKLAKAGPVHGKYRRMIDVYVDITAPLYWWKEFDTYKVGTVANSCSTMHKIHAKEFTMDDFSCEHLDGSATVVLNHMVDALNEYRNRFLDTNNKTHWWQMIQLLPSSYNQRRTVKMNYEVLAGIYEYRKNHKLDEWRDFCKWIESLPYSEIITCGAKGEE